MLKMVISLILLSLSFLSYAEPILKQVSVYDGYFEYACAHDGSRVYCWGTNQFGQVRQLDSFDHIKEIVTSEKFACVLDDTGVFCWGKNSPDIPAELGSSQNISKIQQVEENICGLVSGKLICSAKRPGIMPDGLDHITDFSVADSISTDRFYKDVGVTCVIQDAQLSCWGKGKGFEEFSKAIPVDLGEITKVEIQEDWVYGIKACVLNKEEKLICWGHRSLTKIPEYHETISHIEVGSRLACITTISGQASCWGDRVQFSVPEESIVSISSTSESACGITKLGKIKCWGDVPSSLRTIPPIVKLERLKFYDLSQEGTYIGTDDLIEGSGFLSRNKIHVKNLKTMSASYQSICFVDDDGLQCKGMLEKYPPPASLDLNNLIAIVMSEYSACVLQGNRELSCWGRNSLEFDPPAGIGKVMKLISSRKGYCALTDQNQIRCWGELSELFNMSYSSKIKDLAGNENFMCALLENDEIYCEDRALGDAIQNVPTHLTKIKGIVTAFSSPCAYTEEEVYCWGLMDDIKIPPKVVGKIKSIEASVQHMCFQDDESLKCWGANNYGQYNLWYE